MSGNTQITQMVRMSSRRPALTVFILLFVAIALPAAAAPAASPACAPTYGGPVRVVAVEEGVALRLEDGRLVSPAAVEPPPQSTRADPQFAAHARQALAARLVGTLVLGPAKAAPDRWGRIAGPLFASAPSGATPGDVAEMIVAAGLARVRPSATAPACLPPLLKAEVMARAARRGLWADPAYAVLAADAPASFAGRFGTLQIVEGRITGIGEAGSLLYLNFGPRRGVDFAAVVSRADSRAFDKAGLPLDGLLGRRVRIRGLLDDDPGPHIDLGGPAWIEVIDGT
jgi:micrococcal nuclease